LIYQGFSNDFSSFSFVKQFPHLGKNAKKQWGRGGFATKGSAEFTPLHYQNFKQNGIFLLCLGKQARAPWECALRFSDHDTKSDRD
jgi:hypothetical protein